MKKEVSEDIRIIFNAPNREEAIEQQFFCKFSFTS
jgi:hypothetical protein